MTKTHIIRNLPEQVSLHEKHTKRNVATPRNVTGRGTYTAAELKPVRAGAQDHERVPSRMPDGLHYRDGRVERND